jgi:hemerythrin superfamily protein
MKSNDGGDGDLRASDLLEPLDLPPQPPTAAGLGAYLRWDHVRLALLFQRAVDRARLDRWASARQSWALYSEGITRHLRIEEDVVFPVLEREYANGTLRVTAPLRLQHREIVAGAAEIAEAIGAQDAPRLLEQADALSALLIGHERLEEEGVYPKCDHLLTAEERARMLDQIRAGL